MRSVAAACVYASWISDAISSYNTDFFFQPCDYLAECYWAGEVLWGRGAVTLGCERGVRAAFDFRGAPIGLSKTGNAIK